jgi:outer membrane biosynthesis protein TonB
MSGPLNKTLNRSSLVENLFSLVLLFFVGLFFCAGVIMYKMETARKYSEDVIMYDKIQVSLALEEPKPPEVQEINEVKKKPKPPPQKSTENNIPIDLTKKPPVIEKQETEDEPPQERKQVRQVYGLRKVYSQGLGAGGSAQDAIVGKLGSTLDKEYDTLSAASDDLKGEPSASPVSSAASVTKYPKLKSDFRNRKPQYSKEMLQNRVEGAVKARIMIGADGTVKKVEILSDLGYDSAQIARDFLMGLQFEPAMRGSAAVSVWIPFSIRFELI